MVLNKWPKRVVFITLLTLLLTACTQPRLGTHINAHGRVNGHIQGDILKF